MKKKFLFIPLLTAFAFPFGFSVYASEETTTDVVETTTLVENNEVEDISEETVSYLDQLNDFSNKWIIPIVSGVSGISGTLLAILIFLKKMKQKIENHEKITQDDVDQANSLVNQAKEELLVCKDELVKATNEIVTLKTEFTDLQGSYAKAMESQGKKVDLLTTNLTITKELLCKLVASEPMLATNGYAKQIIELCDESWLEVEAPETTETTETTESIEEGVEVNE